MVVVVPAWHVGLELGCHLQRAGQPSDGPEKPEVTAYIPHSGSLSMYQGTPCVLPTAGTH